MEHCGGDLRGRGGKREVELRMRAKLIVKVLFEGKKQHKKSLDVLYMRFFFRLVEAVSSAVTATRQLATVRSRVLYRRSGIASGGGPSSSLDIFL